MRRPRTGAPALFEKTIGHLANELGLDVEWYEPDPGGREQTYRRDFEMVGAADRVECYFPAEDPMLGGTAHVVEAAMMRDIPVIAWSIDGQGAREYLGAFDPEG